MIEEMPSSFGSDLLLKGVPVSSEAASGKELGRMTWVAGALAALAIGVNVAYKHFAKKHDGPEKKVEQLRSAGGKLGAAEMERTRTFLLNEAVCEGARSRGWGGR